LISLRLRRAIGSHASATALDVERHRFRATRSADRSVWPIACNERSALTAR
jgi:hypothetical protein